MKLPSATGLVIASLALSSNTLAAPVPPSPNPASPNPALASPALDSPHFPNSPDVNSPRSLNQAFFLSRRSNAPRVRRPLTRKRQSTNGLPTPDGAPSLPTPDGNTPVQAEGLGLPVYRLIETVNGAVEEIPLVGEPLSNIIGGVGQTVAGLLGREAAPMERSLANTHISSRDETVSAEGLGLLPPDVASQLNGAADTIGGVVDGLPVVGGLQLGGTVAGLVKTVVGVVARDLPGGASLPDLSPTTGTASNVAYSAASIPMEIISPDGRVFEEVGRVPSKGAGVAGNIIGYLSNGLPIYGALSTASQASSGTPAGGPVSTVAGTVSGAASTIGGTAAGTASMVGNTASGVASTIGGTVAGALSNTPVGGVASQVGQTAAGVVGQVGQTATGAASAALGAAQGILPLGALGGVTNTVGGVLGSLPIVGGATHGGFGILSTPDDPSSVAPSTSSVAVPNPTDVGSATGNSGASSADEPDDSGDDDDYESGDDDGDDGDAKDGTDDGTPIVSSSVSSAMATPTASLPSA